MKRYKHLIWILILSIAIFNIKVYAKEKIPENLDKEWYCNIVKGNAVNNYFNLPSIEEGLKIVREDYDTNADFEDAIDYYNLENYRLTLYFKDKNKVDIGWTSLLYNDNYRKSQNITKSFSYTLNGTDGTFTLKDHNYLFTIDNETITVPSQNFVCYSNLIEAQKHYKLYELNENFDKKVADGEGFIITNGVLTKYIGTKRKLIIPKTVTEINKFDSDNVYYFSSLVIPGSVQKIDNSAFEYLNADEVVISEGVTEIAAEAFLDSNFVDMYLPKSLNNIGSSAFGNKIVEKPTFHVFKDSYAENYLKTNYAQDQINIEYNYDNSTSIIKDCENYVNYSYKEVKSFIDSDGFAIKNNVLYACDKKSSDIRIPNNITTIASEAFSDYYNSKVKRIIVPSSVKKVEYNAFAFTSAKTIVFSEGLEQIESQAFSDTNFKDVYLPSSIKKIGKNIFSTEEGLKGTIFHVEKDSTIAKYLVDNPPSGKYEIKYDYQKSQDIITTSANFKKFKIVIIAAIIVSLMAIIILICNLNNNKDNSKQSELLAKKHEKRAKSLHENIITKEETNVDNNTDIDNDKTIPLETIKNSEAMKEKDFKINNEIDKIYQDQVSSEESIKEPTSEENNNIIKEMPLIVDDKSNYDDSSKLLGNNETVENSKLTTEKQKELVDEIDKIYQDQIPVEENDKGPALEENNDLLKDSFMANDESNYNDSSKLIENENESVENTELTTERQKELVDEIDKIYQDQMPVEENKKDTTLEENEPAFEEVAFVINNEQNEDNNLIEEEKNTSVENTEKGFVIKQDDEII